MHATSLTMVNGPTSRGWSLILLLGAGAVLALAVFWSGLTDMVGAWSREEYGHGYIIPFVGLYLLLQRLPGLAGHPPERQWVGIPLTLFALLLGLVGSLSRIPDLSQYGFMVFLAGLSVSTVGLRNTFRLWVPLIYLAFMVPLPQVVYLKLSSGMQLVSSELGVAFIRLVGVPVFLEGNVIDLGVYKLQVVEACSGLRYLFPLMSFGFLFAAIYRGPVWHRAVLFLSTIPITILMNSFRIAVIGVLVDNFGIEQATGFLHFFEGWIIFIACLAILFGEAWVLSRIAGDGRGLRGMLMLGIPDRKETMGGGASLPGNKSALWSVIVIMALGTFVVQWQPNPEGRIPQRLPLVAFPTQLEDWRGKRSVLSSGVLGVLAADDYLMANYAAPNRAGTVNLFISWYDNQTDGRAVHSPEVCIPGDGWEIRDFRTTEVVLPRAGSTMTVNRAIVEKGLAQQLVYYWFAGRDRNLTNEYAVKFYILWDSLRISRSDGSLVRLVTPILRNETEADAEARLVEFVGRVHPLLPRYVPSRDPDGTPATAGRYLPLGAG